MDTTHKATRYRQGALLLFEEWDFGAGRGPQQKFSIVLRHDDAACLVLHCWPTKLDRNDALHRAKPGCVAQGELSCFKFRAGHSITDTGWAFNRDTYIYTGSGLYLNPVATLDEHHSNGKMKYLGILNQPQLDGLLACIQNSNSVKMRFKRFLFDQTI